MRLLGIENVGAKVSFAGLGMRERAKRLQGAINEILSEEERSDISCSTGWLCGFQKRNGV